jgi:hypothetical protein
MQLYSLESIPYYDSINQSYRNILSINKAPIGPLKDITRNIKLNKLSPFDTHNNDYCRSSCVIGVTKIDNKNELMCVEETSDFFQFLLTNGYTIDTSITKILQKSHIRTKGNLICMFQYNN